MAGFCGGPAYALQEGQSLSSARAELLRTGWHPRETHLKDADGYFQHSFGSAGVLYKAGYIEVESCVGADFNLCIFDYEMGGVCGQLVTTGEYIPRVHVEPKVVRFASDCPSEQAK
jgi:hypothetical protein